MIKIICLLIGLGVVAAPPPPPSAPVQRLFICTVGLDCTLELFDVDLPATPSVRVTNAACGSFSSGPSVDVTGPPADAFDLGTLPTIIGTTSALNICLMSNNVSDPLHSTTFGSVAIVGPTQLANLTCHAGAECAVRLEGYLLSTVPGHVWFSTEYNCSADPSAPFLGLSNSPNLLAIPSTSDFYDYMSFGTVDVSATDPVVADLCWSASLNPREASPVSIGTLTVSGPTSRDLNVTCYLGVQCRLTYSEGPSGNNFIVADSVDSCLPSTNAVEWVGASAPAVYDGGVDKYVFGIPEATNNLTVNSYTLCWRFDNTVPHFLVPMGTLSMIGPQRNDNEFTCVVSVACELNVSGVFDNAFSASLSLHYQGDCASLAALDPNSVQTNPIVSTFPSARSIGNMSFTFDQIGTPLAVVHACWTSGQIGAVPIYVGRVSFTGPVVIATDLECVLGTACTVSVLVELPSDNIDSYLTQTLSLVTSAPSDTDPCLTPDIIFEANGTYDNSSRSTDFVFPSINVAIDPANALVRTVCWKVAGDTGTRAVGIGLWTVLGPVAGMNLSVDLGSSLNVSLIPVSNPTDQLFLTDSDEACRASSPASSLPSIRGVSNPSIQDSGEFSFGHFLGWLGLDNSLRTFTICLSRLANLRKAAVLGVLTVTRPVTVVTTECNSGTQCSVSVTGTAIDPTNKFYFSAHFNCSVPLHDPVLPSSNSGSGQTFTVPSVPGGIAGPAIACYSLLGSAITVLNAGSINLVGIQLTTFPAVCVRGAAGCSIGISTFGSFPSALVFISATTDSCASSVGLLTRTGASSISWTISGSAVTASSGISRIIGSTHSEFGICFKFNSVTPDLPVLAGTVRLTGPTESSAVTCVVGASSGCSITLDGYFDSTPSNLTLVAFTDISTNTGINPCATSTPVTLGGVPFPVQDTVSPGTFDLGQIKSTADTTQFTICWQDGSDVTSVGVPAGILTLVGVVASTSLSCEIGGSSCLVTVSIAGFGFPLTHSVAALVKGTSCDGEFASVRISPRNLPSIVTVKSGSTSVAQTFDFGTISGAFGNVSVCWNPYPTSVLAEVSVRVGPLNLYRSRCDPLLFPQLAVNLATVRAGLVDGSLNPNCQVQYVTGDNVYVNTPLIRFSLGYLDSGLALKSFLDLILEVGSGSLWMDERDADGNSVLDTAIWSDSDLPVIEQILAQSTLLTDASSLALAIFVRRPDLCPIISRRLNATALTTVLVPAIEAGMTDCVQTLALRGVSPLEGLYAAVLLDTIDVFTILLKRCCPVASCLDATVNGTTVRAVVAARPAPELDSRDPFVVAIADAQTADCRYI